MSFMFEKHYHQPASVMGGTDIPPLSTTVVIPAFDISKYEDFALMFQNSSTSIVLSIMSVQVAYDPTGSSSDVANNWVAVGTATLPVPSPLGFMSSVITGPIKNTYKWMRVLAQSTVVSATAATLTVTIGGHRRSA